MQSSIAAREFRRRRISAETGRHRNRRIRCGTCKRNPDRLIGTADALKKSADRFPAVHPKFQGWTSEYVAIAPDIGESARAALQERDALPQSLVDLTSGL